MIKNTVLLLFVLLGGIGFQACQNTQAGSPKAPEVDKSQPKVANQKKDDDGITRIGIGDEMPMGDVKMKDVSGKMISLNDAMGENGLIVNFSCNTCPFVVAWEDRYPMIEKMAAENKMGVILLNSNERKRLENDMADSFDAMVKHAKETGYNSYYTVDKNHQIADAMGAFTTPHIFVFDKDKKLAYKGAIDDNYKDAAGVEANYLKDAVSAIVKGEKANPAETKGNGCSIKRLKS